MSSLPTTAGSDAAIRLHVGAHKTATTYLQDTLALNQAVMAAAGRAYWRLDQVRPAIEYGTRQMRRLRSRRFAALRRKPTVFDTPFNDLAELLALDRPTIISEENLLGKPAEALSGTFYGHASERLGYVASLTGSRPVELWLCVREYPAFLASLYGEALRHGYDRSIAQLVADNRAPEGQWPDLVDRLHGVFPAARIVIWAYEDFARLEPLIMERLCGLPADRLLARRGGDARPSPSAEAILRQAEVAASLSPVERRLSMLQLESEYPRKPTDRPFNPWSPQIADGMRSAYARDLALIRSLPYVDMLAV